MRNIFITFVSALLIINPCAYADEVVRPPGCETAINCTVPRDGGGFVTERPPAANGAAPTSGGVLVGAAGSGAYSQAQAAKKEADSTAMALMIAGIAALAMCNPPTNVPPCILGPILIAASALASKKADEAQGLMNQLGTGGAGPGTVAKTDTTTATDKGVTQGQLDKIAADFKKKGYSLDADGNVTLPNGNTVASDLNKQSLIDAGVSPSDAGKVQAGLDKTKKDLADKLATASLESGDLNKGGGGDGSGGSGVDGAGRNPASGAAGADDKDLGKDPNQWGGYFKQYGDSSIGVANSDIFLMVEKRVDSERKIMGQ